MNKRSHCTSEKTASTVCRFKNCRYFYSSLLHHDIFCKRDGCSVSEEPESLSHTSTLVRFIYDVGLPQVSN